MKKHNMLTLAILGAITFCVSSCEKESNNINPQVAAKSQDASPATKAGFKGDLNPCPVGAIWGQGSAATGLPGTVYMRLVSVKVTGVGEIDTYKTDDPATFDANDYLALSQSMPQWDWSQTYPIAPGSAVNNTIYYDQNKYVTVDGAVVPVVQKCQTMVDVDGNVVMKVTVNLKQQ